MTSTRRILSATALAAVALAGAGATAANAVPAGFVTAIGCSSLAGSVAYAPGLKVGAARATTAVLSATTAGCTDFTGSALPGNGTLSASLSGTSSYGHVQESGQFVLNWPSFYNPSTGTLSVSGPAADGSYTISGTVTGGAFVGNTVSTQLFVTGTNPGANGHKRHLLSNQSIVNTVPLTLAHNGG